MKRLVLIGGGHAHVHVLHALARRPLPDVDVHLVSPFARQIYSGMLPGWIAGHYALDDCVIPLTPLARAAGARFHETAAWAVMPERQAVCLANDETLHYDVLSIDVGSDAHTGDIPGAEDHALVIRPLEQFIPRVAAMRAAPPRRIVLIGAGAAGVELALALRHGLPGTAVTLVSAANTLPGPVGPRVVRALARASVTTVRGMAAARIEKHGVVLTDGRRLDADVVIAALGPRAPDWLRASGLACDADGYLAVDATLQSLSHPGVFAAGDCAGCADLPRPKSGVYAVRAGPPLAENLRRALRGDLVLPYLPQRHALYLLATGPRYAIGVWGPFHWEGAWAWRWKDRIDRAFIERYKYHTKP